MELEVRIERLGAQGDGVAQGPDGPPLRALDTGLRRYDEDRLSQ